MSLNTYFERIKRMHLFIRLRCTGTPREFANKIGISERMLFNYITCIKDELNAPIIYCKKSQTYYYLEEGDLEIGYKIQTTNTSP